MTYHFLLKKTACQIGTIHWQHQNGNNKHTKKWCLRYHVCRRRSIEVVFAPPLPSKLWTLHLAAQKTSLNGQIAGTFTADLFLCLVVARLLTFIQQHFSGLRQGSNEVHLNFRPRKKSISFFIKHLAFLPHIQERLLRAAYLWYWRRPVLHALPRLLSTPVGTKAGCRRSSQCATSRLHCRGKPTSRFIICRSFKSDYLKMRQLSLTRSLFWVSGLKSLHL